MELDQLRAFLEVVRAGSFAAAARASGTPKSTLSKRVADLEVFLQTRLLQRGTRALRLTESGEALKGAMEGVLAAARRLEDQAAEARGAMQGEIKVSIPTLLGERYIGRVTKDFRASYPDVILDIRSEDRPVDLIREGYDCAVRTGQPRDSSLIAHPVVEARSILVAAPAWSALADADPADLPSAELIGFAPAGAVAEWRLIRHDRTTQLTPGKTIRLNALSSIRRAALDGLGVALLPAFSVREDLEHGRLVPIARAWSGSPSKVQIVFPSRRNLSKRVRAFVDQTASALKDIISGEGGGEDHRPRD